MSVHIVNLINKGLGLSDEDCNINFVTSDEDKNEISKYVYSCVLRLTLIVVVVVC